MAGKRGRKKYEEYTHHKLQVSTQIYLITERENQGYFHAKYGSSNITCATLKELKIKLAEAMEAAHQLEWFPVMKITTFNPDDAKYDRWDDKEVSLSFDRYYVAKKPNGDWVKSAWDSEDEARFRNSESAYHRGDKSPYEKLPFTFDSGYHGSKMDIYLNYDEKMWKALEWLEGQIIMIRDMISNALNSGKGRASLIGNSQKALPLITGFGTPEEGTK